MKRHMEELESRNVPFMKVADKQPFRFGDGPKISAMYAVVMPLYIYRSSKVVILRVSVVAEDVPLLVSGNVLKVLGTVLDMGKGEHLFKAVDAVSKTVATETGHIGFNILETESVEWKVSGTDDWHLLVEGGGEVLIYDRTENTPNPKRQGPSVKGRGDAQVGRSKSVSAAAFSLPQRSAQSYLTATQNGSMQDHTQEEVRVRGVPDGDDQAVRSGVERPDVGEAALDLRLPASEEGGVTFARQTGGSSARASCSGSTWTR